MDSSAPPAYTAVQRVTSSGRHLRTLLLALTLAALAVAVAVGAVALRDAFDGGEGNGVDGQLLAVYTIQVSLMWSVAALAIAGIVLLYRVSVSCMID